MEHVTSKDGTQIAFDRAGSGQTLILVGGAFEQRVMESETARLAAHPLLVQNFTVLHYDRRGRGDSSDTLPYALQREFEDIAALIDRVGSPAYLFGISSGASLALEAALALGDRVNKLAVYEPPYNSDEEAQRSWREYRAKLDAILAEGRKGDAVEHFMMLVGATPEDLREVRQYPMWPMWEAVAPTLAYDAAAIGESGAVPVKRAARLTIPVLIVVGSNTYPFMHETADKLADAIPNAQRRTLSGQTHDVQADALAPVLVDFFTGEQL